MNDTCVYFPTTLLARFSAFSWGFGYTHHALTFTTKLHKALSIAGLKASNYSGHSFHRGGATFAFHCGVGWTDQSSRRLLFQRRAPVHCPAFQMSSVRGPSYRQEHSFILHLTPPLSIHLPSLCLAVWAGHIRGVDQFRPLRLCSSLDAALLFAANNYLCYMFVSPLFITSIGLCEVLDFVQCHYNTECQMVNDWLRLKDVYPTYQF